MKSIFKYILLFIIIVPNIVNAEKCSYIEKYKLMKEASKVKIKYEPVFEDIEDNNCSTGDCLPQRIYYFKIYILNASENMRIEVENNYNNDKTTYTKDDISDDVITFFDYDSTEVKRYEFKIYASEATECNTEKLQTIYLTLPRHNRFYNEGYCLDHEDYYLCEEYVEFDDMDINDFHKKMEEEFGPNAINNKIKTNIFQIIWNFIKTNIIWITIVIIVGTIGFFVYRIIRKRREI